MKIGLLLLNSNPLETVEAAIKYGFDSVEIVLENYINNLSRENIVQIKEICSKNHIHFAAHAPATDLNLGSSNNGIRTESLNQLLKSIEIVGGLADYLTFHTGYIPLLKTLGSLEKVIGSIKTALKKAEENELILCLENIHENTINQLLDYCLLVNNPRLQFTLDLAHIPIYTNYNSSVGFEILSDRIRNIHISDNDGVNDLHLSLGKGVLDFSDVFNKIISKKYNYQLTIESLNLEDALKSRDYILKKCAVDN